MSEFADAMERNTTVARFDLLFRLSESIQRSTEPGQVFERALDALTQGLRTDRASILLFDDLGRMRFRASRGLSEEYRQAVDGHSPWSPHDRNPPPVIVTNAQQDPGWASYHALFRAEHIAALAFLPLLSRGRLLGKVTAYFAEPRTLGTDDVEWAALVSHATAQAVSLYQAETERLQTLEEIRKLRQAGAQAEQDRNELLAVTVHDLRNPLNTLKLSLSVLSRNAGSREDEKLIRQLERMGRAVSNMEQFIDSLKGVVTLQRGPLPVQMANEELTSILETSLESVASRANERSQPLLVDVPLGMRLRADRPLLVQAVTHVLLEAIRSTPVQGSIRVCGRKLESPGGPWIEVSVFDGGPGIAGDDLPHVLERPWVGARVAGARLGLFVAKGILEAHGGTLRIESCPEGGAVFRITVPSTD